MSVWFYSALQTKAVLSNWGRPAFYSVFTKTGGLWSAGETTWAGSIDRFGAWPDSHQAIYTFG
jgi:hypothetical protein